MQKVKVKDVSRKNGTNAQGPWLNTRITGEDGAIFGTFHKGAIQIEPGDTIELEPIVKGKNVNFDEWKMVEKGPGVAGGDKLNGGGAAAGGYKRDTDAIQLEYALKAKAQAIERASIESQTAYNGAITLAATKDLTVHPDIANEVNGLIGAALKWGTEHLTATPPAAVPEPKPATTATTTQPDTGNTSLKFADGIALVNYALKQGWSMPEIRTRLAIENPADILDTAKAAALLFSDKDPNDPDGIFAGR